MTFYQVISAYQDGRPLSGTFKGGDQRVVLETVLLETARNKRIALWFCLGITALTFLIVFILILINLSNKTILMGLLLGEMPIVYFLVNRAMQILKEIENCEIVRILAEKIKTEEDFKAILDLLKERFKS